MALNFDASPYLQVFSARQREEEANRPDPNQFGQNIIQGLQLIADNRRQKDLMDMQMKNYEETRNQHRIENNYKYGEQIDPNVYVGNPQGMGQSRIFGNQPMRTGTGSRLIDEFNKFRAGGLKKSEARPEFMDALNQEERKQFLENSNLKPAQKYVVPTYDQNGNVVGYSDVPEGAKPFGGGRPSPKAKGSLGTPDADAAFKLYETARDGLLSGLEGSVTGPIVGRMPAFTSDQQIAEGAVAAMAPVLKQLFRVAGEGVFTDRDQALLLEMIPTRATRQEARAEQIRNIDNIVRAKLRIPSDTTQQPQGGQPIIQRNKRTGQIRISYDGGQTWQIQ